MEGASSVEVSYANKLARVTVSSADDAVRQRIADVVTRLEHQTSSGAFHPLDGRAPADPGD